MSLRQLVDGDCGGVNPLMQLGGQFTRDVARKDEGIARAQFERSMQQDERMVNEFLGQVAAPPQSFRMDTLLQEMRDIETTNGGAQQLQDTSRHFDSVMNTAWSSNNFRYHQLPPPLPVEMVHMKPQQQQMTHVSEFFDAPHVEMMPAMQPYQQGPYQPPQPYLAICPPYVPRTEEFFEEKPQAYVNYKVNDTMEDWLKDYQTIKEESEQTASNYNEKFWKRLQDEWQKLSEESDHPWLTEMNDSYEPYKEYEFAEENPLADLENVFEKGKEYLSKGDIPSAVLCFEAAAKKEPENAEIWELLGISQAENEMDPQSIAALKRSLELKSDNPRVLMALAVCYTNESFQSQAINMLTNWLQIHPKYKHLVEQHPQLLGDGEAATSSTLTGVSKLHEVQELFLSAVRQNPQTVDPEVQEALGVLYNLSSEFDKAVDCFRAALHVSPQNAKLWNRLGASLANGSRSVEAVEAYQHALELEPGFIRVRYNVGVCCMNLKAYKEAAEHLLTALNMQANSAARRDIPTTSTNNINIGQHQMSESIWSTLKMVISLMRRTELHDYITDRNLAALNEAFKE